MNVIWQKCALPAAWGTRWAGFLMPMGGKFKLVWINKFWLLPLLTW